MEVLSINQPKIRYPKNSPEYAKMYYERKKEQILNKMQNYYEQNKENILNRLNEKIICSCGCEVSKVHLQRHQRTQKHLRTL